MSNPTAERPAPSTPPEGCLLTACWGGDAWSLEVLDPATQECVALLAWPDAWPASMTAADLEKMGFEIV